MAGGEPDASGLLESLRALCLSLPEVVEVAAWGHPNFRAGKRTFAVFEHYLGRPCIAVKLTLPEQLDLVENDERFFASPYVGKHGWVSLWLDAPVGFELVERLVLRSYRGVALQRMLRALDAG